MKHWLVIFAFLAAASSLRAADKPPAGPVTAVHTVLGLFSPDRVDDLRQAVEKIPDVKLVSIDYEHARATFAYEKSKDGAAHLDQALRASGFEVKPLSNTPRDKLLTVEIPVLGLDCKGCAYGAYLAVCNLPGVEQATVSFKDGKVTTLVDPERIKRAELEAALKKKQVTLATPPPAPAK